MKKVLFIFGTRPEAIKLAPLIYACRKTGLKVSVCVTAQHRHMLDQVLRFFDIIPDYDLNIMKKGQSLFDLTSVGIKLLEQVLDESKPDLVFVQGDTTTTFAGALAAYYKQIPVAHIEAGLRSNNKLSPFPEEINRVMVSHLADYHFAPTQEAAENLKKEGITKNVRVTGNTVIDALLLGLDLIRRQGDTKYEQFFHFIDFKRRILLVTAHRRESFGKPFEGICNGLLGIVKKFDEVEIIYPVHLNPNIRNSANRILGNHPRIHLLEPLDYPHFIWMMSRSYLILTDSGGVQEEALSLGKPVLVMRGVTERKEGISAGSAKLVGTGAGTIIKEAAALLENKKIYEKMIKPDNPYGDGKASGRIVKAILNRRGAKK